MKIIDGGGQHSGGGRRGHADEVFVATRRHTLNVEARQTPGATGDENKTDQPTELGEVQRFRGIGRSEGANAPGVGQSGRSQAKADDVRERIEFPAEIAFGTHPAGDATVHGIKNVGETDGGGSVLKIRNFSVESSEDGVVATQHVGYGKRAGKDVDTATQARVAERPGKFVLLADGIYAVQFHLANTLSPPFTFSPRLTATAVFKGNQTSTREPKRIRPINSPRATVSPSSFQHITRRAMAPAICLKTIVPRVV